ncbi:MAG: hypothetical protein IPL61_36970 [Myxococcales bacterium]|nr:hypothetical protein [Myxococcales bacterium]
MPLVCRSLVVVMVAGLVACKQGGGGTTAAAPLAAGTERGDCRPDRSCDPGLTCLSNLCVRPPPADCAKVAEALGPIFLDNYTPREERDRFAADVRTECEGAGFTREDGECLARAKTRQDINACPHPIGLGDCKKITAAADELRAKSGVDAYLVTPADRLIERCRGEVPTRAFERCVVTATSMDDLGRCAW